MENTALQEMRTRAVSCVDACKGCMGVFNISHGFMFTYTNRKLVAPEQMASKT
jgi:hypothetical protein